MPQKRALPVISGINLKVRQATRYEIAPTPQRKAIILFPPGISLWRQLDARLEWSSPKRDEA
jgi:hypothetical protein